MRLFMDQMQGLKCFGGHYWGGQQIYELAQDMHALPDIPEHHVQVHPTIREYKLWVCVTLEGTTRVFFLKGRSAFVG